jgi:thiol-disulfide isomerase/thioredoxin
MSIVLLALSAVLLAAIGVQAWLLVHLCAQQRRMWNRIDAVAIRMAARKDAQRPGAPDAPDFMLAEVGGSQVTLKALLVRGKQLLLVFVDPRSGPCYELLPDIAGWQRVYSDRLTVALVSSGDVRTNLAMTAEYGIRPVLLQQDQEVVEAYKLQLAPAAVVIGVDGRIAGEPHYGAMAIRRLVADTLGLVVPERPVGAVAAAGLGHPAPAIRRPDLAGNPIDLAARNSEPTLLLFWSPGCGPCRELVPAIKATEQGLDGMRLIVVSRGPAALSQEAGFVSPVVLDDDRSIAQAYGVGGTPAAVLIDAMGIVASEIAGGGPAVRKLLSRIQAPVLVAG